MSDRITQLRQLSAFCRQVAADGIQPSLAWFTETAELLDAELAALRGRRDGEVNKHQDPESSDR